MHHRKTLRQALGRRFWVEGALALCSFALFVVTLIRRDWVEVLFGIDPDAKSGALEWFVVTALLIVTALLLLRVWMTWRRALSTLASEA